MKTKFFTILFLSFSLFCFAQEQLKIKKEITAFFAKADKTNLQSVLPFEVDGKVGLIDAVTKKVLLNPIKNFQVFTLFNPVMTGYYKDYEFAINPKNFKITIKKEPESNNDLVPTIAEYKESTTDQDPKMPYESGIKGFTVDENGNLKTYAKIYKVDNFRNLYPFKYKGKYYAIAAIKKNDGKTYFGIIDTEGNTIENFDFVYSTIWFNEFAKNEDDVWFIANADINNSCEVLLENAFYINMEGKQKLKGEIPTFPSSDIFGLNANCSGCIKYSGVLDIEKMEWIIKPQSKIKIRWMDYTSKTVLDIKNPRDKNKAKIYIKVFDDHFTYYMDLDMKNKYLPTKMK
ncbi:hypothetical protein [Flavobacterium sp. ASV13]|uniref:hypothetical protein n=1 Tax=Flavobacterium sp. ASV13 TaxID=1506583 RepID=UPI00055529FD|nr:hypothetical protein [Flavobacterium sp. ASV13]